jgi:hypothetical protein
VWKRTIAENVCSFGVRVLTRRAMEPNEQPMVSSSVGNLRIKTRVVYWQPLPCEGSGVGLQFQGVAANFLLDGREGMSKKIAVGARRYTWIAPRCRLHNARTPEQARSRMPRREWP